MKKQKIYFIIFKSGLRLLYDLAGDLFWLKFDIYTKVKSIKKLKTYPYLEK